MFENGYCQIAVWKSTTRRICSQGRIQRKFGSVLGKAADVFDAVLYFPSYMLLFSCVFNTFHITLLNIAAA